ncbi:hypothetical protein ACIQNU_03485 [Streptomyces sp. NPDC091292]|uniref:hypothetical protein n=1 Tax=Streptomyces sp. NPDC091292 TaxID=3365991 RepID=UPI003802DFEA
MTVETTTVTAGGAAAGRAPGRPARPPLADLITSVLFVDFGEGRENRDTGHITYTRPPRARYECLLCLTAEGPVYGAAAVIAFTASIKTDHTSRCAGEHR